MHTLTLSPATRLAPMETQTAIRSTNDVLAARQQVRATASGLGFNAPDVTLIVAALSEVARNIVDHATTGELAIKVVAKNGRRGIQIIACDRGPGIADVDQALRYGSSSRRGIGMGLPGARWLMDEFNVVSAIGSGTVVTMTKWMPPVGAHARAA